MLDDTQRLALETMEMNKQALIFAPSRASAEKTAEEIAKLTTFNYPDLEHEVLKVVATPTKQCRRLSHCIRKGVAFHHSGLTTEQRDIIEREFRAGRVKIISCTPTLAAGVSMPAFRVIIKSLKRFSDKWGMEPIPVLEYLQMAGRAGRPEYEKFGEAITIAKDDGDKEDIYERYICGVPEDIYSKLSAEPVLRTYLLSLISAGIIPDIQSMRGFFAQTFWAHQYGDMQELESKMKRMLSLLQAWKLVMSSAAAGANTENKLGFTPASSLAAPATFSSHSLSSHSPSFHSQKLRATLLGKRISELYVDPLTAHHLLERMQEYIDNPKTKTPFSLLQMIAHTLEMRPLLSVKSREQDKIQEELVRRYDQLLEREPSAFDDEYDTFIHSIKTALFLEAWTQEYDEDFLLETFDVRPGEIRVKLETADWLLYASSELAKILGWHDLIREVAKLRIRVKYGAKQELLPLLRLKGIGRVRARKLFSNGFKDLGDLKKADAGTLAQILGKAVADDVKKQLGQETEEVPAGKRKGQLSIEKF